MNFHIHKPVEYEKIIADQNPSNIELTRHRMAVQQLLDAGDNHDMLVSRLQKYIECFDKVCLHLDPTKKLHKQPYFHWVVDSKGISSSCWKFEGVIARALLSSLLQKSANVKLSSGKYIAASKDYKRASDQHKQAVATLQSWKWKLPSVNHPIIQTNWHVSMVHHLKSLQDLCMLCIGFEKETNSNTMYTVAQRSTKSAATSIAFWPDKPSNLKLCQYMQARLSSDILWERQEYGASIHRLQNDLAHNKVETFGFKCLQNEIDKIPFLLKEREQVNNGAYFDPVKAHTPLPTPEELIRTGPTDVPHPQNTRNSLEEPVPTEEHAQEQPFSTQ